MKTKLTLYVDDKLISLAKKEKMNISRFVNDSLEFTFSNELKCVRCDKLINISPERDKEDIIIFKYKNMSLPIHEKCIYNYFTGSEM